METATATKRIDLQNSSLFIYKDGSMGENIEGVVRLSEKEAAFLKSLMKCKLVWGILEKILLKVWESRKTETTIRFGK